MSTFDKVDQIILTAEEDMATYEAMSILIDQLEINSFKRSKSSKKYEILLLENSKSDADLLVKYLKKEKFNFSYTRVWQKESFVELLNESSPDLIIAEHSLSHFSGLEAFHLLKNGGKDVPFILVAGTVSDKLLSKYIKVGIDDYILKENLLRLPSAIEKVLNKKKIEKLNSELLETNSKLQNAYSDIRHSINYARVIQNAMLPEIAVLENVFQDSFIFYKPKDVLSGDFYWFQKKGDVFYIAVADCTGHGVPGALLSMMGYNLLNEAVNIKKILIPSEVLKRLNRCTRKILAKDERTIINDGMDIAFCTINVKEKSMQFAGANRPLIIVRDNKLLEYKPNKTSIGGINNGDIKFTDNNISIKTGDRIFLFSDGYADQFHHNSKKKIMNWKLKELFVEHSSLPMNEQKKIILDFFEESKGDLKQTDDVLLIGIEIP